MALTLDEIRQYCFRKPGRVTEGMPFGDDVLVLKVEGKIFLLANLAKLPLQVNVKADPERAIAWREQYEGVLPGYHMNKKHWNTVVLDGSVPVREVMAMIDHSFELVSPSPRPRRPRPQRSSDKRTSSPRTGKAPR